MRLTLGFHRAACVPRVSARRLCVQAVVGATKALLTWPRSADCGVSNWQARPVARASEPSFLPKGAARRGAAADGGVLVRHGADGRGGTAKALRPAGITLQACPCLCSEELRCFLIRNLPLCVSVQQQCEVTC